MGDLSPCPKCGGRPYFGMMATIGDTVPGNIGCLTCRLSPNDFKLHPDRDEAESAWAKFVETYTDKRSTSDG